MYELMPCQHLALPKEVEHAPSLEDTRATRLSNSDNVDLREELRPIPGSGSGFVTQTGRTTA
jgi:hypothetical protein